MNNLGLLNKELSSSLNKNIIIHLWYLAHEEDSIEYKIMEKYWSLFRKLQEARPKIHQNRTEYITCFEDVENSKEFNETEKEQWKKYFSVYNEFEKIEKIYEKIPESSKTKRKELINNFICLYN